MRVILLLILVNLSLISNAQKKDSLYLKYTTGYIYRMGTSLMKGNDKISFQELSREFSMSDLGLDQYKIAKRKKTIGRIFLYSSFLFGLGAAAAGPNNPNLGYGLVAGQFLALMGSMSYTGASNRHLDRAIWIRNKDYLFPSGR